MLVGEEAQLSFACPEGLGMVRGSGFEYEDSVIIVFLMTLSGLIGEYTWKSKARQDFHK